MWMNEMGKTGTRLRVTSFDVARRAGVSRASVSRAFSPGANISPELRERVLAAAAELGYRPNRIARGLNRQRSDLVGIVVARLENPFRAAQVKVLTRALLAEGLRPILFEAEPEEPVEEKIELLLDYNVSGVIITSSMPPEELCTECIERGVPLVAVDRGENLPGVDHLDSDCLEGGRLACEVLLEGGAERLVAARPTGPSWSMHRRVEAFAAAARARGIPVEERPIGSYDYEGGRAFAKALADLAGSARRAGVFLPNDISALGCLDGLRHDLRLGALAGLGLVGHDDIPQAGWASYRLTTIRQELEQFANAAVELFASRIAAPDQPTRRVLVPVSLVRRDTHRGRE
ncbi:MAG: LacI family DNA-binding transcriptional regulator [Alphaproteobacteria bacterium]|nr:MAG: LacI family DNA-binding transcriptional regulator [Alphaproteobacteria bacterium]